MASDLPEVRGGLGRLHGYVNTTDSSDDAPYDNSVSPLVDDAVSGPQLHPAAAARAAVSGALAWLRGVLPLVASPDDLPAGVVSLRPGLHVELERVATAAGSEFWLRVEAGAELLQDLQASLWALCAHDGTDVRIPVPLQDVLVTEGGRLVVRVRRVSRFVDCLMFCFALSLQAYGYVEESTEHGGQACDPDFPRMGLTHALGHTA
jgi:hypothetical protein